MASSAGPTTTINNIHMMGSETNENMVLQALGVLYGENSPPEEKQIADKWLTNFQSVPAAWEVGDRLLRSNHGVNAINFGALTIHVKIRCDYEELPPESHVPLRDSLLSALSNFKDGPDMVLTRVCLAVVAMAIQMEEWENPVQSLAMMYGNKPEFVNLFLTLMSHFPEESCTHRLHIFPKRRTQVKDHLRQSAPDILNMLVMCMTNAAGNSTTQHKIFRCLLSWLRFVDISCQVLVSNPLIIALFDALKDSELFEIVVEIICELLRISEDITTNQALVQLLIPAILKLLPIFRQAVSQDDYDSVFGLTRIFTEAAEMFIQVVLQATQEGLGLVSAVLECSAYPDTEISNITWSFWSSLTKELVIEIPSEKRDVAVAPFVQYYAKLLDIVLFSMRFPENYDSLPIDKQKDFKEIRRLELAPALRDCATVIGNDTCLAQIGTLYSKSFTEFEQSKDWRTLEACLYGIRSIARSVLLSDSQILPQLLSQLINLPQYPSLQYTAILTVGRYADWLRNHTDMLIPLLNFVTSNLGNKELSNAAALAFKHICNACGSVLIPLKDSVFQLYENCGNIGLHRDDHDEILKGVGYILSTLPRDQLLASLERLCLPLVQRLHELTTSSSPDRTNVSTQNLLQILGSIIRYSNSNESVNSETIAKFTEQIWPVFDTILAQNCWGDDNIIEKVCRCIRCFYDAAESTLLPLFPVMLGRIAVLYNTYPHSSVVYTLACSIKHFGPEGPSTQELLGTVISVCLRTFNLLSSLDALTERPDLAEDQFNLLTQILFCFPNVLFSAPATSVATLALLSIQWSIMGILLQHPSASQALLRYIEHFVVAGKDTSQIQPHFEQVMNSQGQQLVHGLLLGVAGGLPGSARKNLRNIFSLLKRWDPIRSQNWFVASLSNSVDFSCSDRAKQELATSFFTATRDSQLLTILEEFAYAK